MVYTSQNSGYSPSNPGTTSMGSSIATPFVALIVGLIKQAVDKLILIIDNKIDKTDYTQPFLLMGG